MADEPKTEAPEAKAPEATPEQKPTAAEPKTFTQDDLDRVVSERLKRERDKYSDYGDLKDKASKLSELEEENKSELEKLTGKVGSLDEENKSVKAENLRLKVALSKGLTGEKADLADRLRGSTQEELEADADTLLAHFKPVEEEKIEEKEEEKKAPPPPSFDGGPRETAPDAKSPERAHNELIAGLFGDRRAQTT